VRVSGGRVASVHVQTTEKVPYNVTVTARGPSGHGSVPLPGNALAALARAVSRIHDWRAPVKLNETTRLYFEKLAEIEPDLELAAAMRAVATGTEAERERAAEIVSRVPGYNAILRTGQSLTMLNGGFRSNVIPSEGQATFNVRVLPGDSILEVVDAMRAVAGESAVELSLAGAPREDPPVSPVDSALFRALESAAKAMAPDAVVVPMMSTGATDGAALRRAGIPTYGILPLPLEMEDELRMHGDDERAPVRSLGWASELLYRTLSTACGAP
jgi:acetylornithine deacetylase/succinyl-diaminopimelate desuccinylase-like protein